MINGQYSVAELKDLIAAKDFDLAQLGQHYADYSPTWVTQDSTSYVAWTNDWNALQSRYASTRSSAETTITEAAFIVEPDSLIPADAEYKAVLAAVNPSWAQNTNAPGSLGDLDLRLTKASGAPTDYSGQPQPTPGSDADLNALNTIAPFDIIGQLTGQAQGPANPRTWPTWAKWLGGGAVAAGVLWGAAKVKEILS